MGKLSKFVINMIRVEYRDVRGAQTDSMEINVTRVAEKRKVTF